MGKKKYVYYFGNGKAEGRGSMSELLGGKGANLAEMTSIGLPVPPGFTITTEVRDQYYQGGAKLPKSLLPEIRKNVAILERELDKKFGDARNPLLVSVRLCVPVPPSSPWPSPWSASPWLLAGLGATSCVVATGPFL